MKTMTILIPALLAGGACTDSVLPTARVVSAAPTELVPANDLRNDLVITVAYEDGDGDLGGGTARVFDCRAEALRTDLPIPDIAPEAVIGEPITGTLELRVNDVGAIAAGAMPAACRQLGAAEAGAGAAVFCVELVDAEGNTGDGDCTGAIAVMAE